MKAIIEEIDLFLNNGKEGLLEVIEDDLGVNSEEFIEGSDVTVERLCNAVIEKVRIAIKTF